MPVFALLRVPTV